MSDEKKKRGRPKSDRETKNNVVAMRINDKTNNKLDELCENYNVSKAELLEKWINNQYVMMENGIDLL